ncbi:DUF4012 domain-containing protein [Mycolicibacterium vaccae]|uniref:DUF4012 domain-containing protein n=1 Tax=Mycolicibacterium vaccae ATCC 25954 TaxID=1194972 RepID=K0V8V9_MYCVA|nr:DUF4012 domain-containing protein [Mycolicibacterium vaccae]ANI38647.1 membrane protein [Mycolicibacterium vaccae 95051]EJZ11328.1 hypothetical protein MVAC_06227 [Mycolicibacterium vaccae ATCC 25954]
MNKFFRRRSGDRRDDDLLLDEDERGPYWLRDRHGAVWTALALVFIVVAFGVWLGVRGFEAKNSLEHARSSAQQAKDALLRGETETAAQLAADARTHAQSASDATHSVPWNIVSVIPWLGDPFETGQQISTVVLGLAADVLQPSTDVGSGVAPDRLLKDGRLDVQRLRAEEPQLRQIAQDAANLNAAADQIPDPGFLSVLEDARIQVQSQTSEIAGLLENTALAARVAPAMMGADGPRTYFMGFQTNAEARGTGGLLGGFGILRFNDGTPSVDTLGPNTDLRTAAASLDLGPEYMDNYGYTNPFTDFRNSNLSSHFPYAAQIWRSMWADESGESVDGVLAIDPVALSYILGAVGAITMPDGEKISKDNVVELTESTAYIRYPDDQTARKNYLQDIASEVVRKITGPVESPRKLLDALGKAAGERRLAVWSSNEEEQRLLESTPLANAVPNDTAPFAAIVVNNLGGNKLDYYLERELEYVSDGCDAQTRMSTVTVRLKNTVPDVPLPDYIVGIEGLSRDVPFEVPRGTMVTSVRLVSTVGSSLVSVLANGERVPFTLGAERGHPTYEVQVLIPPGQSGELSFHLSEPTAPGAARMPVQPLVDDVKPKVSVPACGD